MTAATMNHHSSYRVNYYPYTVFENLLLMGGICIIGLITYYVFKKIK